jgi:hypothetical protein
LGFGEPEPVAKLKPAPAGQQVIDQHNNCQDKQDVNEAAADVQAEAKEPEDNENDKDRPKHKVFSVQIDAVRKSY